MARPGTIDKDPRRREIVAAIARGDTDSEVSRNFANISIHAVARYREKLRAEAKAKAKEARELARKHAKRAEVLQAGPASLDKAVKKALVQEGAAGMLRTVDAIASQLETEHAFLVKLRRACDRWLSDPDNPGEHSLAPRTTEIAIHVGLDGYREKTTLGELLNRAEAKVGGLPVTLVENGTKVADTRKLIRETVDSIGSVLEKLAKVTGILRPESGPTLNVLVLPETKAHLDRVAAAFEACAAAGCTRCADAWEARR